MASPQSGWAALVVAGFVASQVHAATEAFPAGLAARVSPDGLALADRQGRPVYRLDLDRYAKRRAGIANMIAARCADVCDKFWRPIPAPQDFRPAGDWGMEPRNGARPQLTYKGDPLYTFTGKSPAETASLRIAPPYFSGYAAKSIELQEGVPVSTLYWHAALYQPPAPEVVAPAGVGVRWFRTDYVFAYAGERTLYTGGAANACADACGDVEPLIAPLAALALGPWRPVEDKSGQRYWSYRGQRVYVARQGAPDAPAGDWQALQAR